MMQPLIWFIAVSSGFIITYVFAGFSHACSTLVAAAIIMISFLISHLFKVAGRHTVSKMGTDWLTQELRQMAWRVALSLILAGLAFKLAYPEWGIAFWLSVAIYYQIGLVFHLRNFRYQASKASSTIKSA